MYIPECKNCIDFIEGKGIFGHIGICRIYKNAIHKEDSICPNYVKEHELIKDWYMEEDHKNNIEGELLYIETGDTFYIKGEE
jgi:hypothetical protein